MNSSLWYRVNFIGEVSRVEVLKETPQFVSIKEWGREHRRNKAGEFFPTFEEMKRYLVEKNQSKVRHLEDQLNYARKQLEKAEAMEDTVSQEVES